MDLEKNIEPLREMEAAIRDAANTSDKMLMAYERFAEDTDWSKDSGYDTYTRYVDYGGPVVIATALANYLPERKDVKILDVGAGTGLIGEQLKDSGFHNIDALDPCKAMTDVARRKIVYKQYLPVFFTSNVAEIGTDTYDVLVSSGCLIEGHLKCDHLPEMIRCIKTGGLVLLIGREHDIATITEFKDRLEPLMKQLEEEGQWTRLERRVFPGYHSRKNINGVLFVFRITK